MLLYSVFWSTMKTWCILFVVGWLIGSWFCHERESNETLLLSSCESLIFDKHQNINTSIYFSVLPGTRLSVSFKIFRVFVSEYAEEEFESRMAVMAILLACRLLFLMAWHHQSHVQYEYVRCCLYWSQVLTNIYTNYSIVF